MESRVLKVKGGTVQAVQFPCLMLHTSTGMVILATDWAEGFLVHRGDRGIKKYGESQHENKGWTFNKHSMGSWRPLEEGTVVVLENGGRP